MNRMYKAKVIFTILAVFLVTFGLGTMVGTHLQGGGTIIPSVSNVLKSSQVNILFMGIDARKGEVNARSDTMILASIDKKKKQAVLVWIPRDTRVEVSPGHYDKINSVNALNGPEEACKAVGDLLDINVKYYVVTNFSGFVKIIDILGGVTIDVESNMYHPDPDPNLNINLSKGVQVLNGQDALRYVRYRGGPTADIGRTGRQAQFITAVMDEMISTKTISRLPQLLPELMENIHTNIPVKELPTLLKAAQDFGSEHMITQTLPGYSFTDPKSGASYWQADEEITPGIIKKLFEGETFDVMSDPPDWVSNSSGPAQTQQEEVSEEKPAEEDLENPDGTLPEGEEGSEDEIVPDGSEGENTEDNNTADGDNSGEFQPPDENTDIDTGTGTDTGTDTSGAGFDTSGAGYNH